ncbi:hypothetical protein T484DRAFT_1801003 [Baffinella frigidus]|nr:hypothetical protein T484DRAFT_1801003 [Cryptophyta sp. CCMP2293]
MKRAGTLLLFSFALFSLLVGVVAPPFTLGMVSSPGPFPTGTTAGTPGSTLPGDCSACATQAELVIGLRGPEKGVSGSEDCPPLKAAVE